MTARGARWLLGGLLIASAAALATVRIEDTDAWTHLALGRAIVQDGGFPAREPFNFPSAALPYYNSEWLFGLVLYLVSTMAGLGGVIVLKASIAGLAFLVLFKDALVPRDPPGYGVLGVAGAALVLGLVLLVVRHRFVERPDIVLMVLLAFTVYALSAYVHEGRRLLYLLPAVQVVWVNMHPSVVAGAVPFVAFLVGGGLQRLLQTWRGIELPDTPSLRQLRVIGAVFVAVAAASLLNPYGIDPFLAPFRLATSAWLRHEIMELQPPRLGQENAPFVIAALLALAFLLTARRLSLVSVLLVGPFAYLGFSGRRFVFLLAIVSGPVLVRHLRRLASGLDAGWAHRLGLPAVLVAATLVLTGTVATGAGVGPFRDPLKVPGFGISYDTVPEGALRYLDRVGVSGRVFNTFHWGGYITWRDFPRRAPFVDGRGYLPPGLLDDAMAARRGPRHLERLRASYGFEIAIVDYPLDRGGLGDEVPDVDFALSSPDWALVYWDDLALVYLRRAGALAVIAERDEYRLVRPANGAPHLRRKLASGVPREALEAELERNVAETGSSVGLALLGFLYNDVGLHAEAIGALARVRDFPLGSHLASAYQGLGFAHARLGDAGRAIEYYTKAARLKEDPQLLHNLGVASARAGKDRDAIRYLERALDRDPNLVEAYPALVAAYRRAGLVERAQRLEGAYPRALGHAAAEEQFRRGVRFYVEGRHHEALAAFERSIALNPASASSRSNLGYLYFDLGRFQEAFAEQRRALEVNPNFANAHYGLALIYERRGEPVKAREHFREYLRLDPRGYWSRRAQEAISGSPGAVRPPS